MRSCSIDWIETWTKAQRLSTHATLFSGIGSDTRADLRDQIFIALKGETFDAHDFVDKAVEKGATALLVDRIDEKIQKLAEKVTVLKVENTLIALQKLGLASRRQSTAKILALTGSNGKTTTKEFTATILAKKFNVHWSKGSFNNHWGVPFSLLGLRPEHQMAVFEVGMNHFGEIENLIHLVEPDTVVCTMVGRAHIEFFGSEEKIAQAKEEIYLHSLSTTSFCFNLDNQWTSKMYKKHKIQKKPEQIFTFSSDPLKKANVNLIVEKFDIEGMNLSGEINGVKKYIRVPIFGAHNVTNLMSAATLCLSVGLTPEEIWEGLLDCKTIWGRGQLVDLKCGAKVIFDAYNANPDSMKALLDNVKEIAQNQRLIGLFGQMKELGDLSARLHEELGQRVSQSNFSEVFFVGEDRNSFLMGLEEGGYRGHVQSATSFNPDLAKEFAQLLRQGDLVVIKGSRGARLEKFLDFCSPIGDGWKKE